MRSCCRLFLALLLVGILGLYPLLAPTVHHIDAAHFNLIQRGMTRAEVEAIFGVPPGAYDWAESDGVSLWDITEGSAYLSMNVLGGGSVQWPQSGQGAGNPWVDLLVGDRYRNPWESPGSIRAWTSRHGAFNISFDNEGRVIAKSVPGGVTIVPIWQRFWRSVKK